MESAPGCEKTNTESSRVIHNAARDREMARRGEVGVRCGGR